MKSTGTKEVIYHLENLFVTFAKPKELITDRGTAYTSSEFTNFISKYGVKHRKVAVAASWANGIAERISRFLKSSLTKLIDSPADWKHHLGTMQYIMNNTIL